VKRGTQRSLRTAKDAEFFKVWTEVGIRMVPMILKSRDAVCAKVRRERRGF
jgi:hypothetical protein